MLRQIGRNRPGFLGGVLAYLTFAVGLLAAPPEWLSILRENSFDAVLLADFELRKTTPDRARVIVVDIDQRSLVALGPWPWPRETMARLVDAVAEGKPRAIAIDILFAGKDTRSPAALARQLGAITNNAAIAAIAETLTDGDRQLSAAIRKVPTAIGFTFDAAEGEVASGVPVLRRGQGPALEGIWRAPGAIASLSTLSEAAAGNGVLSLPGDADGKVRRVPLLVGVADVLRPGLALEAVRLSQSASTLVLEANPQRLAVGSMRLPLASDGFLRLAAVDARRQGERTVSAIDVIEGRDVRSRLAETVTLIGGSAPELGGLREMPRDPLTPSVQIQANAVAQLANERAPTPAPPTLQLALTLTLGAIALAAALFASPALAIGLGTLAIGGSWLVAVAMSLAADRLLDPLTPSIGAFITFLTASVGSFVAVSRREARIRNRFEQHLAPAVVRRIAENPEMLKLRAEKREVTALFTDIEGFTSMTHRAEPEQLVAVLDAYIEGVTTIIMDRGGMVDKIVGDAVHALFNAPIDLDNHPRRAVECAIAIRDWTGNYRARPEARRIEFGRTRIGIETGIAIVGDIGIRSKLDYTAHGDAINSAARLEALNKEFGSSICIGPIAASRCDASLLRPLGRTALRGLDAPIAIFEPWPAAASSQWRERYLAASQMAPSNPLEAARLFAVLADETPSDAVPRQIAERLRNPGPSG